MPSPGPIPCKYFSRQGGCTRGDTCIYSHVGRGIDTNSSEQPIKTICTHYQRGLCRFGNLCKFAHTGTAAPDTSPTASESWRSSRPTKPPTQSEFIPFAIYKASSSIGPGAQKPPPFGACKFFQRGYCAKGEACTFSHPQPTTFASSEPFQQTSRGVSISPPQGIETSEHADGATLAAYRINPQTVEKTPEHRNYLLPLSRLRTGHPSKNKIARPSVIPFFTHSISLPLTKDFLLQTTEPLREILHPSVGTTERIFCKCKATFGAGAIVTEVLTPFDSRHLVLSNLPAEVKQEEFIKIAEPFGALSSIIISDVATSGLTSPSARLTYSGCAEADRAVEALNGKILRNATLKARLDVRAIESGAGILLSRKVKISWYAPTVMAWAHYPTISAAKRQAADLEGQIFQGCCISASFQTPSPRQTTSFSVEIKNLPLNSTAAQVTRLCQSVSASVSRPSYNRDAGILAVRSMLVDLVSFDIRPADRKKITAFAEFSSAEAAATAVSTLNRVRQTCLGGSPLWLEQIHSVKYSIPARQFKVLLQELDQFRDDDEYKCKIRYYERDENGTPMDPVCVRIYGPDAKAVGTLKFSLENLVGGSSVISEGEGVYDQYLETAEGEVFIQEINSDPTIFVKLDTRTRSLRVFGPSNLQDAVKDRIIQRLADVRAKRHIIPLERDCLKSLLTGGLNDLYTSMGADKISLDVVARNLVVKGSTDEVEAVRRAISTMLTSPATRAIAGEEDCPVCFCEISDPVRLPCGHSYCSQCLRHFLLSAACADFSTSTLRCMADIDAAQPEKKLCWEHIPYATIRGILSSSEEAKLLEASFLSHIHVHPAIPPSLLYLTIYNPSLRPEHLNKDDEDAEEQAHILFYTSKERAVSRDRMLRQIGLAKALVNFSEMFSPTEPCNDIHSQSKRMVMLSPEPNFWIHAAVELAKSPRPVANKGKGKQSSKDKDKAREKERELPAYEYHDGSVHDLALRNHMQHGYEKFKVQISTSLQRNQLMISKQLTHGSLTGILSTLGQEALELQLERFFTPWAWMWDMESTQELSLDLGVPLHPLYREIIHTLDTFSTESMPAVVVSPPYLIPSTSFVAARYPSALSLHVLSLAPPSREPSVRTIKASDIEPSQAASPGALAVVAKEGGGAGFLGMSTVSMNMPSVAIPSMTMPHMSMDVRKWGWSGMLGLSKGGTKEKDKKILEPSQTPSQMQTNGKEGVTGKNPEDGETEVKSETGEVCSSTDTPNVDTNSLEDAMASDTRSVAASIRGASESGGSVSASDEEDVPPAHQPTSSPVNEAQEEEIPQSPSDEGDASPTASQTSLSPHIMPAPVPEFSVQRLFYLRHEALALVLVAPDLVEVDSSTLTQPSPSIAENAIKMLDQLLALIQADSDAEKAVLPSATKILQPKDKHIISRLGAQFTDASPAFAPNSEQFYNSRQLLHKGSEISEVFSRGQNPQHWHVARKGLGIDDDGRGVEGEVLLEISRKEATLTDVDNVLVSVVKRFN
ncbi:hypothetical protein HWV62_26196 [Athelia sp. TMB]|nr:hypothetical protein HWV62_26196 [Athelia sp. TMB]